jgi:type I restriction enzyme R subunit
MALDYWIGIDKKALDAIKRRKGGDNTKVINLIKSIEKAAEENSDDPFLIAMADRAKAVQENFEDRQTSTADALDSLIVAIEGDIKRQEEQAKKGLDGLSYFVYRTLLDHQFEEATAEEISTRIKAAFVDHPNWGRSEASLRELRTKVTFAIYSECDDLDQVTAMVDNLFNLLERTKRV